MTLPQDISIPDGNGNANCLFENPRNRHRLQHLMKVNAVSVKTTGDEADADVLRKYFQVVSSDDRQELRRLLWLM
jgi:hypothetical protein